MAKYYVDASGNWLGTFDGVFIPGPPDDDGNPTQVWLFPEVPEGAVEVPSPPEDGGQKWDFGAEEWGAIPPPLIVLYPVDLWSRMTDAEADQVEAAMAGQTVRIQNVFKSASSYRSDHELWALLQTTATQLFGAGRAAEILAPSIG